MILQKKYHDHLPFIFQNYGMENLWYEENCMGGTAFITTACIEIL